MTTPSRDRKLSDPMMNPGDEPYFVAAAQGRLMLKQCHACGESHHYPRPFCPFCWSSDVDWLDAKGTGTVMSYSVTRRGAAAPFCIAYVTLDEGPTMMTNIVDTDLDTVHIGQRVQLLFKPTEGGHAIAMFTPAREEA